MSLNKWIGMGRLTSDPEFRQTQNGTAVCRFTVASNRNYKGQNGEQQADFINCVAWRNTAEFVNRYFKKGSMIIVEGSLQNNNYTDSNGVKHYSMVVNAENVQFGESKTASQNAQNGSGTAQTNNMTNNAATAQKPSASPEIDFGDLNDFEDILSDGEPPF